MKHHLINNLYLSAVKAICQGLKLLYTGKNPKSQKPTNSQMDTTQCTISWLRSRLTFHTLTQQSYCPCLCRWNVATNCGLLPHCPHYVDKFTKKFLNVQRHLVATVMLRHRGLDSGQAGMGYDNNSIIHMDQSVSITYEIIDSKQNSNTFQHLSSPLIKDLPPSVDFPGQMVQIEDWIQSKFPCSWIGILFMASCIK